MSTTHPPTKPAPNAAAIRERKKRAAAARASDLVEHWLHHLGDEPLCMLAGAVYREVDERERTRARTTDEDAGGTT